MFLLFHLSHIGRSIEINEMNNRRKQPTLNSSSNTRNTFARKLSITSNRTDSPRAKSESIIIIPLSFCFDIWQHMVLCAFRRRQVDLLMSADFVTRMPQICPALSDTARWPLLPRFDLTPAAVRGDWTSTLRYAIVDTTRI